MKDLIGYECSCIFNLPHTEWPIEGYPAWVTIDAVDMPMVKMRSIHAGRPVWVNATIIKSISSTGREVPTTPWWVRLLSGSFGDRTP